MDSDTVCTLLQDYVNWQTGRQSWSLVRLGQEEAVHFIRLRCVIDVG